jgi:UDP-GlcNAc:undecaprenyl-phosphate/decaprenyl-phosphate GlcNAc-1-phosphate transferase
MTIRYDGWLAALTAALFCLTTLPAIRSVAIRFRLYDWAGPLKIHTKPIPRLGGIALIGSVVLGAGLEWGRLSPSTSHFFLGLLVVWLAGLIDDLRGLAWPWRLAAQLAGGLLLSLGHWRLLFTGNAFFDCAATCLFVAVFTNAFNFLDGADGVAAGIAAVIGLGYVALYGYPMVTPGGVVAWALVGGSIGFLFFNFPPATIFMGDAGSNGLGFTVAFLGLDFCRVHHAMGSRLLLPIVFAGIPLFDMVLAIWRRLWEGDSPFLGDRRHFYDLLLQRGWSARRVAFSAYSGTGLLLIAGWLSRKGSRIGLSAMIPIFVLMILMLGSAFWLGSFRPDPSSRPLRAVSKGRQLLLRVRDRLSSS